MNFLSPEDVANSTMQCNAISWRHIYTDEVMNSDFNGTFYIELVNYLGHVSVEELYDFMLIEFKAGHINMSSYLPL